MPCTLELKKTGRECLDCVRLAKDLDKWRILAMAVFKI
jgi:hypothetical protein